MNEYKYIEPNKDGMVHSDLMYYSSVTPSRFKWVGLDHILDIYHLFQVLWITELITLVRKQSR